MYLDGCYKDLSADFTSVRSLIKFAQPLCGSVVKQD